MARFISYKPFPCPVSRAISELQSFAIVWIKKKTSIASNEWPCDTHTRNFAQTGITKLVNRNETVTDRESDIPTAPKRVDLWLRARTRVGSAFIARFVVWLFFFSFMPKPVKSEQIGLSLARGSESALVNENFKFRWPESPRDRGQRARLFTWWAFSQKTRRLCPVVRLPLSHGRTGPVRLLLRRRRRTYC